MLVEYKNNAISGIVGGMFVLGGVYQVRSMHPTTVPPLLTLGISIIGIVLWIWGCFAYAKGKGYSKYWGLLGFLYLLGLLILALFPDKHKNANKA
ncbi:MAG: hypothetical protein HZA49_08200 [Planctomycetes bacterium]|nr:hypothetical protein [Planctomycetota bacterium]